jgi:hypothetical protein
VNDVEKNLIFSTSYCVPSACDSHQYGKDLCKWNAAFISFYAVAGFEDTAVAGEAVEQRSGRLGVGKYAAPSANDNLAFLI